MRVHVLLTLPEKMVGEVVVDLISGCRVLLALNASISRALWVSNNHAILRLRMHHYT